MDAADEFDLERFVRAQSADYEVVKDELRRGQKRSHWIWYVFPQLRGLGYSSMAQHYGIGSKAEALAYWRHPILGPRLRECTDLVIGVQEKTAEQIFGATDAMKFRSCVTLFGQVAPEDSRFSLALQTYFEGEGDLTTLKMLSSGSGSPA